MFDVFTLYRGGVVFWGDQMGAAYVYNKLKGWSEVHGAFYKPCSFLEERAIKGISLV